MDKDTTQMDADRASHVCLSSTEINEAVNNHVTRDVGSMHASSVESPGSRRHTSPNYPGKYTFVVSYYVFFWICIYVLLLTIIVVALTFLTYCRISIRTKNLRFQCGSCSGCNL